MKKTKLKFAAAVAALAMTFALFTGCNPGEDATTDNTSSGTETTTQTPTESGDGEEEKEPEKVGSTEEAIPTTLEFNKAYTGYIEYTYETSDSTYKTVSPSEVMLSVPKTGLVADGTVKLTYKISGISSVATSVTNQGVFDKWAWGDTVSNVTDGTSVTKRWSITQAGLDSIEGDNAQFKIVPQYSGDDYASKVNTSFKLTVTDLTLTYTEPAAAGEPKVLYDTEQEESGNVSFSISYTDLASYTAKYETITFTLKNKSEESRSNWGVLTLISQETSGTWPWHNIVSNSDLGTNEYGQVSCSSLDAGATGTVTVELQALATAIKAEEGGESNQLALQTSNDVVLVSISLQ